MKRLIVHIGPRKTGSTTIQTMLASHRDALSADGVYVPHAGTIRANRGTHIRLARELVHGRPVQWECLAAEVRAAGPDCCVLSVEDFALPRYRAAAAVRLAEFAARQRLDVDLLAYVRAAVADHRVGVFPAGVRPRRCRAVRPVCLEPAGRA